MDHLTKHPDAKSTENRYPLAQARHEVQNSLKKLEILKPRINTRYERFEQLLRDRDARVASAGSNKPPQVYSQGNPLYNGNHERYPSDPALAGSNDTIVAAENPELAVKLAHDEIRRRATARKATRQAGISEEEEHERRTAGLWGDWEEALAKGDQSKDQDVLRQQMQNVRHQVNGSMVRPIQNRVPTYQSQQPAYRYPTIPIAPDSIVHPTPQSDSVSWRATTSTPGRPPKYIEPSSQNEPVPPSRPAKEELAVDQPMSRFDAEVSIRPDIKASDFTFTPSAYLENGTPLRTIWLPPDLRLRFLALALPNTRANLETCGILCGTLISNALFISKLVIPDQESTSDTCETVNESALFDYVDGEDLMVLGWIHTHPTQTCFMSSRDLHTHAGYQMMMPESIAIVCAPSKGE